MTWNDLLEAVTEKTHDRELAQNIVGHWMDDYECWNWKAKVPASLEEEWK